MKGGTTRIAMMIDSPCHAYDQARFAITEAAVQDVHEYNRAASEW
ncbi:MAG: hypothetical protein WB988_11100 [Candidatus Nitrosopolaris sp.]